MKLALVRARYNPAGGAERFAERAMLALTAQGSSVSIIARSWSGSVPPEAGWNIVPCDPFYLGSIWRDWSFARAVRARVHKAHYDLVQSHERIPGLPLYRAGDGVHAAWLERRCAGMSPWRRLGVRLNPHHRYLIAVERALFEHPDLRAVICNSSLVEGEILARFRIDPQKLHRIPNGVDLTRFHPQVRSLYRSAQRARLGIDPKAPVLLFVGSGFERKGLALALAALAQLPQAVQLVIVGEDKRRRAFQKLAAQLGVCARCHFTGALADLLPYLGLADALVLPTLYDPFPNAALEALACGLPVITSDACGAVDVIEPGKNGWIHHAGDADDLRLKLEEFLACLADPSVDSGLRQAARDSVASLGIDALATALLGLYRQLL